MTSEKNNHKLNLTQKDVSSYYFIILLSSIAPPLALWTIPYFSYKTFYLRRLKPTTQDEAENLKLYESHYLFMLVTQVYFLISVAILSGILKLSFSFKVLGLVLFIVFTYLFLVRIISGIDAIYKKQQIKKPFNIFGYLDSNHTFIKNKGSQNE